MFTKQVRNTALTLLAAGLLASTCVTPEVWRPQDHQNVMKQCRQMCGRFLVDRYEPLTGECVCAKQPRSRTERR